MAAMALTLIASSASIAAQRPEALAQYDANEFLYNEDGTTVSKKTAVYQPMTFLYGGVEINDQGLLTTKALFRCAKPELKLKTANDGAVEITLRDRNLAADCRMDPALQPINYDLSKLFEKYRYDKKEIHIKNQILFNWDDDIRDVTELYSEDQ